MNIPMYYYCDVCEECYSTENAANKCRQLPLEEVKFSIGTPVLVGAGKNIPQTGTVVGIKYIAGFSGGKHFASYTVELADKSLVQRNARSLKMCTPVPHPNKQEILDGIASGREWEFRLTGKDEWLSPVSYQILPAWSPAHEYRLKPVPDPHPNRAEVEAGIKAGKRWEVKHKESTTWTKARPGKVPIWSVHHDYRLTPETEYVPLGPEDVPPGSVFRGAGETESKGWCMAISCSITGIRLWGDSKERPWVSLAEAQINRSFPSGWDANAWEPCKKLKQ